MTRSGVLFVAALGSLIPSFAAQAQDEHVPKDRVVILRATAEGAASSLSENLEDHLADAVKKSGRLAVYEQVPAQQIPPPHPDTEVEARTIAEIHGSQFLIAGQLRPASEGRVQVELRVGSVEHQRYDTARFEVDTVRLAEAVAAVASLALREEGLGSDGVALTRAISEAKGDWASDSRERHTANEQPSSEKRLRVEEQPTSPKQLSSEEKPRTSVLSEVGPLSIGAGVAMRPLLTSAGNGGVLIGPVAQGRYRLFAGFSAHANLGLMGGAGSALELSAGVAFLPLSLENLDLRLGAALEIGAYLSFSGSRDPALLARVSPTLFWALSKSVGFDLGLLEFGWISGADALTLGGHARLRYSF